MVGLFSRGGYPVSMDWRRKGNRSVGESEVDPHACALGSLATLKFDSESSASHGMRLLDNFGHIE